MGIDHHNRPSLLSWLDEHAKFHQAAHAEIGFPRPDIFSLRKRVDLIKVTQNDLVTNMGLLVLNAIADKKKKIPEGLKPAIAGSVHIARRNYSEITGQNKSRTFFYREGMNHDDRTTLFQRNFSLVMSHGLASETSGDLMEAEMQSWFDLLRELRGDGMQVRQSIWEKQEETDAMLNALRSSIVSGNRIEARFHLVNIRRNVDTMLRLCETLDQPLLAIGATK